MKSTLLIFILLLGLVGAFTLDSFVFHVVYLVSGAFLLGNWWITRSLSRVTITRKFPSHAFPGETVPVQLKVSNQGRLPIPWLFLQESLPLEVSNVKVIHRVLSLASQSNFLLDYTLYPRKRGYYSLGPTQVSSGDLLGLSPETSRLGKVSYLTVYPKVVSLRKVRVPSRSPMGVIHYPHPIFEDPTRPIGKRPYSSGDSLRRIDWKSSAASNQLQVKVYDPSISLETVIFLDLIISAYPQKFFYDASELAIIIAASLAQLVSEQKQAVGLISNGRDSRVKEANFHPFPPRKGRSNLILLLEALACIQLSQVQEVDLPSLMRQHRPVMPWGTTQIVITGYCDQILLTELINAQKSGGIVFLVLVGDVQSAQEIKRKAQFFDIPCFFIRDEQDLNIWQR